MLSFTGRYNWQIADSTDKPFRQVNPLLFKMAILLILSGVFVDQSAYANKIKQIMIMRNVLQVMGRFDLDGLFDLKQAVDAAEDYILFVGPMDAEKFARST